MFWFRMISGVLLILLGILGTMLPIIPGVALIVAGLSVIGTVHPPTARLLRRNRRRIVTKTMRWWRNRHPKPAAGNKT